MLVMHRRGGKQAQRAVASLEFGLIAPVVATLLIGVFDIAKVLILQQEVWDTAHSVSLTASLVAVQTLSAVNVPIPEDGSAKTIAGTTTLSQAQVQQVESAIYAEIPWLSSGVEQGNFAVVLSGIEFSAYTFVNGQATGTCTPYQTCSNWVPFVVWSVPYAGQSGKPGTPNTSLTRACGPVTASAIDSTTPLTSGNLMTTLRTRGITYPDPILVADVSYTYTPMFPLWRFIGGPVTLVASAYWPVREIPYTADTLPSGEQANQLTLYDLANTDSTHHCAGYP